MTPVESSNGEVAFIVEAIASICRCGCRSAPIVIKCRVFAIGGELLRHFNIASLIMVHHVAAVECLIFQLESLAVATSIKSILFFDSLIILSEFGGVAMPLQS